MGNDQDVGSNCGGGPAGCADAAELHTRFTELDKNNDGKLSREEYNALHEGASGATSTGKVGASGADERQPGRSPAPGKGGGDASTSGANTK